MTIEGPKGGFQVVMEFFGTVLKSPWPWVAGILAAGLASVDNIAKVVEACR